MTTRVSYNLKDALLIKEVELPSESGTRYSEVFDLECIGQRGVRTDPFELLITIPELPADVLPNNARVAVSIELCDSPDFTPGTAIIQYGAPNPGDHPWTIVGIDSNGSPEREFRHRVATDAPRYARMKVQYSGPGAEGHFAAFSIVT